MLVIHVLAYSLGCGASCDSSDRMSGSKAQVLSVSIGKGVCYSSPGLLISCTGIETSARQLGICCRSSGLPSQLAWFFALAFLNTSCSCCLDVVCNIAQHQKPKNNVDSSWCCPDNMYYIVDLHSGMPLSPAL